MDWDHTAAVVNDDGVQRLHDEDDVEMQPDFVKPVRTQSTMNVPKRGMRRKKTKKVPVDEPMEEPIGQARNPFLDREIAVDSTAGLTSDEVAQLLKKHGYNEVVAAKESFGWTVFKMYVQPINILGKKFCMILASVAGSPSPAFTQS